MDRQQSEEEALAQERYNTLFLRDFCHVCDTDLKNSEEAASHYNSTRHKLKLQSKRAEETRACAEQYNKLFNTMPNQYRGNLNQFQNHNILRGDVTTNTGLITNNYQLPSSILKLPPVNDMPNVIGYLGEDQILTEYNDLKKVLINSASRDSRDQSREKIKLELVVELEKLMQRIYTPNHLPLEFIYGELKEVNNILQTFPSGNKNVSSLVEPTPVPMLKDPPSFEIYYVMRIAFIGVVLFFAYKFLRSNN
ncbi:hypothetical protein GWI33_015338 [Rhynchophorus ferrugineus]|uniref:Uncharacterized protein n=1 Tax=Rhynchophorus ferrugineus TaxID=354439 RepID=A0A834M882_RHYFE|nr:hypothetical protein GWI33_015338 [Rhynchophorus ferrugineus]